jgi:DNA repair protein RAD50
MASLKRLYLQGVRSFGAEEGDEGSMAFSSPLTLILGQNGCGKTTLIEALKYATSGELPANSKCGAYFVHDPKLTSFIEVVFYTIYYYRPLSNCINILTNVLFQTMGQVKLAMTDVKGKPITITRTFKAIQKLKDLSFSTGDITIKRYDEEGQVIFLNTHY